MKLVGVVVLVSCGGFCVCCDGGYVGGFNGEGCGGDFSEVSKKFMEDISGTIRSFGTLPWQQLFLKKPHSFLFSLLQQATSCLNASRGVLLQRHVNLGVVAGEEVDDFDGGRMMKRRWMLLFDLLQCQLQLLVQLCRQGDCASVEALTKFTEIYLFLFN